MYVCTEKLEMKPSKHNNYELTLGFMGESAFDSKSFRLLLRQRLISNHICQRELAHAAQRLQGFPRNGPTSMNSIVAEEPDTAAKQEVLSCYQGTAHGADKVADTWNATVDLLFMRV